MEEPDNTESKKEHENVCVCQQEGCDGQGVL